MHWLWRALAFVGGSALVLVTLRSAVRTFVLPRSARDPITRFVFLVVRRAFDVRVRAARTFAARDAVMALYAPVSILGLMFVWVLMITAGYTAMFWADGVPLWRAYELSGSSLLTLGFEKPGEPLSVVLSFSEAALGLTLVALLVAYLPAMYTAFARRETEVTMLEIRAGSPPSAVELLLRVHQGGGMAELDRYFETWQLWFAELEENHTSLSALTFFRSPQPNRSWVTAAGAVLDAVAIAGAVLRRGPSPSERMTLRAGVFALRRIAAFFELPFDEAPDPTGPVAVRRAEFDAVYERLRAEGLEIRTDSEQAWADFVAARAQYEEPLLALAALTMAPYAPWSSDRSVLPRDGRVRRPLLAPRDPDPTALP